MTTTLRSGLFVLLTSIIAPALAETTAAERLSLPIAPRPFTNTVAPTEEASTPDHYATAPSAPVSSPNVLLIMTDDAGFAASSAFGGAVETPTLERLANEGLRYTQFHTTGVCSPTRAALLTGRNHHAVGMGSLVELDSPYEGYVGDIPPTATIARVLGDNGYATAMFGKDHNVPIAERTAVGPFESWPTGRLRGFDYFYGFISGDTSQWRPSLYENTRRVDARGATTICSLMKNWPTKPFIGSMKSSPQHPSGHFLCTTLMDHPTLPTMHRRNGLIALRASLILGWDEFRKQVFARQKAAGIVPDNAQLTPRPDMIEAWNSLPATTQRVYARYMEVFAAQLAFQDAQTGRLIDELERLGLRDNTIVIFIEGDNGASGRIGCAWNAQ